MNVEIYSSAHFLGLIMVFIGVVGLLLNRALDAGQVIDKKFFAAIHGIGMLLVLVAGFGLLAKKSIPFDGWVIGKLVILIILGLSPVFHRFVRLKTSVLILLALASTAIFLVKVRPF